MKEFTLTAQFVGADGSLGYCTGKEYKLTVVRYSWWQRWLMSGKAVFHIARADGTGECPYQSLESFWRNWRVKQVPHYAIEFIVGQLSEYQLTRIEQINQNPFYSEVTRQAKIDRVIGKGSRA